MKTATKPPEPIDDETRLAAFNHIGGREGMPAFKQICRSMPPPPPHLSRRKCVVYAIDWYIAAGRDMRRQLLEQLAKRQGVDEQGERFI